jgi:hypothetical protein
MDSPGHKEYNLVPRETQSEEKRLRKPDMERLIKPFVGPGSYYYRGPFAGEDHFDGDSD